MNSRNEEYESKHQTDNTTSTSQPSYGWVKHAEGRNITGWLKIEGAKIGFQNS